MITRYVSLLSQDSTDMSSFMDNLVLIFKQCGFTEVDHPIGSSADNYRAVQFNNLIIDMWSYSNTIKFGSVPKNLNRRVECDIVKKR